MADFTSDTECRLQSALYDFQAGRFPSLAAAAVAWQVNASTLRYRAHGRTPKQQVHQVSARLTTDQENTLARYIKDLQLQYAPTSQVTIAQVAWNLAGADPRRPIGKNWVNRFIHRTPGLTHGRGQPLGKERIAAAIPDVISKWFEHLQEVIQRYNIGPADIWNMDEIGFQMGHHQKNLVVFDRRSGPPKAITSGTTAWVSSLECISAAGQYLMPLVIHRGTNPTQPLDHWFPPCEECPNWTYGFSGKGWTNNDYAVSWLRQIFIPATQNGSNWRLLVVDGHGSHTTAAFQLECLRNQVVFIYLLAHTSHLMQPCDLGPFASIKRYYSQHLSNYIRQGKTEIDRAQFNVLYHQTRESSFKHQYIMQGWSRTGLYPLNIERVLNKREIRDYRAVTPDLLPPSTEFDTPSTRVEFQQVTNSMKQQMTPQSRRKMTGIQHAFYKQWNARVVLQSEETNARKRTREVEEVKSRKLLKKVDQTETWNLRKLCRARGWEEDAIDLLLAQRANRSSFLLGTDAEEDDSS
jgi:DDE superfamily endonuclease/Tc5 transposase DNA-binding domain